MAKGLVERQSSSGAVSNSPRIGLILGGGGARGLAHIVAIEAFEELGLKPTAIVGTSIGAIFGAATAAGLTADYMRAHLEETFSQRLSLIRQLFAVRAPPVERFLNLFPMRTALLDAEALLELVLPLRIPETFGSLSIPLTVVATDFYLQEGVALAEGRLRPAIAASIALPVIFHPVTVDGRIMMDGGLVDPLPFDRLSSSLDVVVAIDVSGVGRTEMQAKGPGPIEALTSASLILQRSIIREKLRTSRPDILIDMPSREFGVLEFHRWREILEIAAPAKELLKRQLSRVLGAETVKD